jgi:hypothetical protein
MDDHPWREWILSVASASGVLPNGHPMEQMKCRMLEMVYFHFVNVKLGRIGKVGVRFRAPAALGVKHF